VAGGRDPTAAGSKKMEEWQQGEIRPQWQPLSLSTCYILWQVSVCMCMFAIMYNLNVNNLAQRGKGSRGIKSSK